MDSKIASECFQDKEKRRKKSFFLVISTSVLSDNKSAQRLLKEIRNPKRRVKDSYERNLNDVDVGNVELREERIIRRLKSNFDAIKT
ncbi:CLUMA_CG010870, isoform A [Clunio marinus]|uniref:CLUMA_CG010870, isoform A n=1 Tax=Clunio marinus TaxID=568069 RepID=A0A1J1IGA2_9DIPT|nr:CLUMA_CG010870, isoform A [Clunio marinus]